MTTATEETTTTAFQQVLTLARKLKPEQQQLLVTLLRDELDVLPESATLDEAIQLVRDDRCSLGRAAELAGVTQWDLKRVMHERGTPYIADSGSTAEDVEAMVELIEARYGNRE